MDWTVLDPIRLPNVRPWVIGGKIAISCHKDREFLIRAWTATHDNPNRLLNWILHYTGRMNLSELEWFGYTYSGQPSYMMSDHRDVFTSGLTIQYFVEPTDKFAKQLLDEGRVGPIYGSPKILKIPDNGYVQKGA